MSIQQVVKDFFIKLPTGTASRPTVAVVKWIDAYDIHHGRCQSFGTKLKADHTGIQKDSTLLTPAVAESYAAAIDAMKLNVGEHRGILKNQRWLNFYKQKETKQTYLLPQGGLDTRNVPSLPCMACGIYLPFSCIDVDHQHPLAGGEDQAVTKVLRILGLTTDGAHGTKGQAISKLYPYPSFANVMSGGPGRTTAHWMKSFKMPNGHAIDENYAPQKTDGWDKRYTTNTSGTLFVSLIKEEGKWKDLQNACINSFANLKPLCRACNILKSNTLKK